MLLDVQQNFGLAVSVQIEEELITPAPILDEDAVDTDKTLFADFILNWLEIMKPSIELTTYISNSNAVKGRIAPYFRKKASHCKS